MLVSLVDIGKKYHDWVFKGVNFTFQAPVRYGIIGKNGSGKSTLLKIISGFMTPSQGEIIYRDLPHQSVKIEEVFNFLNFTGPYVELIEELTVLEHIQFHIQFKSLLPGWDIKSFLDRCQLKEHRHKVVQHLSSGLMQRLKLGLCMLSESRILMMDEPTSYLDEKGKSWFKSIFQECSNQRLVIVASNDKSDIALCEEVMDIESY